MTHPVSQTHTLSWVPMGQNGTSTLHVAYRGVLSGPDLWLHYGFDGWQEPLYDIKLEHIEPGLAVSEPIAVEGHLLLDGVVTDGQQWDNNSEVDYRLWIDFDPIDAHLHASGKGSGGLGINGLQTAMASAGMRHGIVSWIDNRAMDRVDWAAAGLYPLVWVRPGETSPAEVAARLAAGFVGLKLHPTVDDYRADDPALDPYLEIAAEAGVPVACHSAPGEADPDHIRRLAERFPTVPVLLYHTYLGPHEGRWRAVQHVREQPNLYLETSWCQWRHVHRMVQDIGPQRVLFGSDASVDGHHHYCRRPPNVEGQETYNEGLLHLIRALGPEASRQVLGENTQRLFGVNGSPRGR